MKMKAQSLFEGARLTLDEAIGLTVDSLRAYGERYRNWVVAYSGGKDSTATLMAVVMLIEQGLVPRPESLTVLYADTEMELPPLQITAMEILKILRARGVKTRVVLPQMDDRFFVYMFGRGVPPPKNRFRWCTSQIKVEPMLRALEDEAVARGFGYRKKARYCSQDQHILGTYPQWREMWKTESRLKRELSRARKNDASQVEPLQLAIAKAKQERKGYEIQVLPNPRKMLMITGVRLGESVARDQRIVTSCSRDGAECGQGWFQETTSEHIADTLAPLLHWRVCHISDYLEFDAPEAGFPTLEVLNVYHAGEEGSPIEIAGRTGCVGCNLASQDFTLDRLIKRSQWAYLAPFKRLRPLYAELTKAENRLRKTMETRADGELVKNCGRLGPLTMEARRRGLLEIFRIQNEINRAAKEQGRPTVCLINPDEAIRINELIAAKTWPDRWTGDEQLGDEYGDHILRDGSIQPVFTW